MKSPLLITLTLLAVTTILIGTGSGCAWSIGDSKHEPTNVHPQPTRGQELIDLKKALDQGAISQAEYEKTKQQIMEP